MTPQRRNADNMNAATLAEWLQRRAVGAHGKPALTFGHETLTYGQLQSRIEEFASLLVKCGIGQGDRVAYLGLNHPIFLIALFACARIGAIFVPLNFRLTAHELQFILDDAGACAIICDPSHRPIIDSIQVSLNCRHYLVFNEAADGWEHIDTCLGSAVVPPVASVRASDTAIIMYTSGTTGRPKGAELTHLNLWSNNINWLLSIDMTSAEVGLNCAPLFHVGGLCVIVLPILMAGGHVILQDSFDPAKFLATLEASRVTLTFSVPAMMQGIAELPQFSSTDLSAIRLWIAGGASVPEPLLRKYAARRIPISQGWGMTESATAITFLAPVDANAKLGSCGKAVMMSEFRLTTPTDEVITKPYVAGEIRVRGTNVMKGYWNRPEATDQAFDHDGWYRSGDVGYVDEDGFLYICDRLKDMIITGGENVYSAEVESVLFDHPAIAEIAVIGQPDEQWGERVVAVAAIRQGSTLTLEDLRMFAGDRLARYKLPRELRLVEQLPRNSSGKVLKHELRSGNIN